MSFFASYAISFSRPRFCKTLQYTLLQTVSVVHRDLNVHVKRVSKSDCVCYSDSLAHWKSEPSYWGFKKHQPQTTQTLDITTIDITYHKQTNPIQSNARETTYFMKH